tara:strand:+ start:3358 stop:5931 length:2574 start_codon:yes stop_codon:yes gene_type:complete
MTKKKLTNDECKELCLKLLYVDSEKEVEQILKQYKLWDYKDAADNWRLLGDSPANWSVAGNQQAKPVPSLVEKLVNSIDAVLISKCKENGIDPKSNEAPQNMYEAVEKFFGVENGLLEYESNRTKLAQNIHLVCTGLPKKEPCYTVIDKGEGQTPGNIHSTILSLPGTKNPNKKGVPFVQGIFNMGGTGVTRFCGEQSIQLIITKRNPKLLAAGHHKDTLWSFTILRRRSPTSGRQSSYIEYLAPNNHDTLTFESDTMPLLPKAFDNSAKSNSEHAYSQPMSFGTCIKLYEYKNPGLRSNIQLDLNYELGRHFFMMGLPIRLEERRLKTYEGKPAKGHSFDSTLAGMNIRLQESRIDLIKEELSGELNIDNVGPIQVKCYVLQNMIRKNTEGKFINTRKNYHSGAEIQVIVNGQQHGLINKALYCRKTVGLEYLTDDLFIILDATNITPRGRESLFMASRDRLAEGKEKLALEDGLVTWLKDNTTLHIINEERKQAQLEKAMKDTTVNQEVFKNLVKQDPTLAEIFPDIGFEIPRNKGFVWKKTKGKYKGNKTPSFFRLENDEKNFNVLCPMNKSPKIVFEHDALNDYFTRNVRPARLTLSVYDKKKKVYVKKMAIIKSRSTDNGITNVRIQPLSTTKIGDKLIVQIQLTDKKYSENPLVFKGKIKFIKKSSSKGCQCECHQSGLAKCNKCEDNHKSRKKSTKNTSKNTARKKNEIDAEGGEGQMSLPIIQKVEEDDSNWVGKEFTKHTGIKIAVGSGFTIFLNMDNESFKKELQFNKDDAELISKLYQTAWQFLAVGMYHRMDQQKSKAAIQQNDEKEKTIEEKVAEASEGIAMVLVPIITKLAPQAKRQISTEVS